MSNELSKAINLLTHKKNTDFFYGYIPENTQKYFDDGLGADTDLKIKPSTAKQYLISGSIDTSSFDAFRQGVELTRIKHFDAGSSVKIHAGEPGHILRKNAYGFSRNYNLQNAYKELENFNAVAYLMSSDAFTYPIVSSDNDETENYNFNGVIEPLTIRALVSMFSIDVPFEAHDIKASIMSGNQDITNSSDVVVTIYTHPRKQDKHNRIRAWLDMIDMVGEVKKIPTMGFFNDEKTFITPFIDDVSKIELSTNFDDQLKKIMLTLNPDTENYISNDEYSSTCGWSYDDVWSKGTDSIAFGGLGY